MPKIKVAADLPPPRPLTSEDYEEALREAEQIRKAFDRKTSGMERLTAEELATRLV